MTPSGVLVLLLLLLWGAPAAAATYHVDAAAGADANTGLTPAAAWRTLARATAAARAGDTVLLRGTFPGQLLRPGGLGTAGAPITFTSAPGQTAVLEGGSGGLAVDLQDRNHIHLKGLRIQNVAGGWAHAVFIVRGSDNVIDGCEILNVGDERANSGDSIWIANGSHRNRIVNNTMRNGGHSLIWVGGDGLGDKEVGDTTISGNTLSNPWTTVLGITWMARRTLVERNRIADAARNGVNYPRPGIQLQASENIIRYNEVVNNAGDGIDVLGYLNVHNEPCDSLRNQIYHNVVYGNGKAGLFLQERDGRSVRDNLIANNLFVRNATGVAIEHYHNPTVWPAGGLNGNRLVNNSVLPGTVRWARNPGQGGDQTYTLAQFQQAHGAAAINNLEVDPGFTDAAKHVFTLRAGSPAIDRGLVIPGVAYRGAAPDLGANEMIGAAPAPPPPPTPPPPVPSPPPAPPPAPPRARWPNEPAGFAPLTDWGLDQALPAAGDGPIPGSPGWWVVYNAPPGRARGWAERIADPGAPGSPSHVYAFVYPQGMVEGTAPATVYYTLSASEVYAGFWWKPSSPFDLGPNGNKIAFLFNGGGGAGGQQFIILRPDGRLHVLPEYPGDFRWRSPNVNATVVTLGVWHRIEWQSNRTTGTLKWWLDGVLQGSYSDVRNPHPFDMFQFSPTWGGNVGARKAQRDSYWFDHVRLSTAGGASPPPPPSPAPPPVPPPTPSPVAGELASTYPGDVGIERDPAVVFVESFETGTVMELATRWGDAKNPAGMSYSPDVPSGSRGTRSLLMTAPGTENAVHLFKVLTPQTRVYLRYYVKYAPTGSYHHSSGWLGGYNPPTTWPNPRAGAKPGGDDLFSVGLDPLMTAGNTLVGYAYWMGMQRGGDGMYWGNNLTSAGAVQRGQWHCVETMIQLNDPVTATNGEWALWLDGRQIARMGPGFPAGTWVNGIFRETPGGAAFPGFQWRTDVALRINWIWLQHYATVAPKGVVQYDHVVAATTRVGCFSAAGAPPRPVPIPPPPRPAPTPPAPPSSCEATLDAIRRLLGPSPP